MEALIQQLKQLSSAEDFLDFFGVAYDESVVNVSRLHILKRFFQYIRQQPQLPENDALELFSLYRDLLLRSYSDFVTSTPAREKVFKVFQDVQGTQHVPLERLKASLHATSI